MRCYSIRTLVNQVNFDAFIQESKLSNSGLQRIEIVLNRFFKNFRIWLKRNRCACFFRLTNHFYIILRRSAAVFLLMDLAFILYLHS
ncbi:hypothetical protein D3C71_2028850 [compost metagenome]